MHLFYELTFTIVSFFYRSTGTMDLIDTQTFGFIIAFLVAFVGLVIACSKRFPNGKMISFFLYIFEYKFDNRGNRGGVDRVVDIKHLPN
jgi:hypothetical protein